VTGVRFGSERLSPVNIAGVQAAYPVPPVYKTLVGDVDGNGKADLIWNEATTTGDHIYAVAGRRHPQDPAAPG
jgi:hypothetical protein